jgi:nucleotide-binding universal stress UspA family protein
VGIDGSPAATRALEWAAREADLHGATLKVVHIWEYPYAPIGAVESEARDRMQVDAACVLDAAVERAREICGADVDSELLEGSPAMFLPTTVETGDLLVLGSRGRGAVRAGLFGSTVNAVLDEVSVSVAVVPAPHR